MAIFTNQAQLRYGNAVANSNVAVGEILEVLAATKTAVRKTYGQNDRVNYVVSIVNSGNTAMTRCFCFHCLYFGRGKGKNGMKGKIKICCTGIVCAAAADALPPENSRRCFPMMAVVGEDGQISFSCVPKQKQKENAELEEAGVNIAPVTER